jgi:hypothetical protein
MSRRAALLATITVAWRPRSVCWDRRRRARWTRCAKLDCATTRPPGGEGPLQGRCETLGGRRVVRFLEYDHLQAPDPSGLTG